MTSLEFVRTSLGILQSSLDEAVGGLSTEQAHWRPGEGCNHIAFVAWHYSRTVDNMVRFVLQREPTVWMSGKWDERFGLDSKAQGTGMAPEDAAVLRIADVPAFCGYIKDVWSACSKYLETLTDDHLERTVTVRPLGELTVGEVLGTTLLTHGYTHLGEVWLLRGLQGLKGSPF